LKFTDLKSYIGSYLIEKGEITEKQLQEALIYQNNSKGTRKFLGQVLVDLGYTSEEMVAMAVAKQAGVPFVSLEKYEIDNVAVSILDQTIIKRYQALPIAFENGRLVVAMVQPRDVIAIDDLRIISGYEIQPVLVTDSELVASIETRSRTNFDVEQAPEEDVDQEIVPGHDAAEKPAVKLANLILSQAVHTNVSDIHVEPQERSLRIRYRIDGVLHETMRPPRRLAPSLVSRIKVMANMDIAERRIPQDGRTTLKIDGKTIDVRVASLPSAFGEKLTLRILDRSSELITLKDLGFPVKLLKHYDQIMRLPYGFILVTGPTGSGKSTTLYSSLKVLNSVDKHIITIEDPIERRLDGINQIQVNNQAGMTFASGLRSILRNDPDIIMVGEIRDHETARIAVESALTGHLVLSTLHTNDSAGAITRLADMGIEPYLTASSLIGVVAQRLVRTLCSHCKKPYDISRKELLKSVPDFPLDNGEEIIRLYKPQTCIKCSETGYRGRVGVYEFLIMSEGIGKLTLMRSSTKEIKEMAVKEGMITLRQEGLLKAKKGITSLEEVLRVIV